MASTKAIAATMDNVAITMVVEEEAEAEAEAVAPLATLALLVLIVAPQITRPMSVQTGTALCVGPMIIWPIIVPNAPNADLEASLADPNLEAPLLQSLLLLLLLLLPLRLLRPWLQLLHLHLPLPLRLPTLPLMWTMMLP